MFLSQGLIRFPESVEEVISFSSLVANCHDREQLREQHELTQEIGNAITSMPLGEPVDEDELEQDLANLEQEKLDEQMLDTGPGKVPQGDKIEGLNEGKSRDLLIPIFL